MDVGEGLPRLREYPLAVETMYGLGDTVYQRPMLRALAATFGDVYVRNPWPELLEDLPGVHLCHPNGCGRLRTQTKNAERNASRAWAAFPPRSQTITAFYGLRPGKQLVNIVQELERSLPMNGQPFLFDVPRFGCPPALQGSPVAVVRPVTLRREWVNTARAPRPEYVHRATELLRERGYHTVSIADVDPPHEWLPDPLPECDEHFLRGQLNVSELMALIQSAAVVVGGVGFIVPCTIASGTAFIGLCGGEGGHNAPDIVTDPRMDLRRVAWIRPDRYCRCTERLHDCPKTVTNFDRKFLAALDEITRPLEAVA